MHNVRQTEQFFWMPGGGQQSETCADGLDLEVGDEEDRAGIETPEVPLVFVCKVHWTRQSILKARLHMLGYPRDAALRCRIHAKALLRIHRII